MSLDLSPDVESRVLEYAASEGVNPSEAINRLLSAVRPKPPVVAADDPVLQFLSAQMAEAENATPEEVAEAESEWLAFRRSMNDNRRATGERLLFPEAQP